MDPVTLYQFELCPYCHKVKAGLEVKGIPFKKIEVNPTTKKELPPLPEEAPKKVPVIQTNGETVYDSSDILHYLDKKFNDKVHYTPADAARQKRSEEVDQWVDDEFTYALPTVIYGTWREALRAAQITARTSNFGPIENLKVRAGGSLIMYAISKRILKKRNKTDGHKWVVEDLEQFEEWLGSDDFIGGDEVSLGDVAMHGAVTCVKEFPIFAEIMGRPKMAAWYNRVQAIRDANRAN
ncbi:MAG: glutathione S-transferase [Chrysiogenetes bacterium]|nr:glutathione S-transferase [Chrysiogenetes bacterium]